MDHKKSHYNFIQSDIAPLVLTINMLGENLTGLELGVYKGSSFMTLLHNCENIKKLYGVDSWKPYADYLKDVPDGKPGYFVDEKESEFNKMLTNLHLKYGIPDHKEVVILEEDSLKAVEKIEDQSLDFIFFDAMMTEKQTYEEAMAYYPKIKKNGYFTGHDSNSIIQVIKPIEKVKNHYNNDNKLISYNNCFIFKI